MVTARCALTAMVAESLKNNSSSGTGGRSDSSHIRPNIDQLDAFYRPTRRRILSFVSRSSFSFVSFFFSVLFKKGSSLREIFRKRISSLSLSPFRTHAYVYAYADANANANADAYAYAYALTRERRAYPYDFSDFHFKSPLPLFFDALRSRAFSFHSSRGTVILYSYI